MTELTPTEPSKVTKPCNFTAKEVNIGDKIPMEHGKLCPNCGKGVVVYDAMLNLRCLVCGAMESGSFT